MDGIVAVVVPGVFLAHREYGLEDWKFPEGRIEALSRPHGRSVLVFDNDDGRRKAPETK